MAICKALALAGSALLALAAPRGVEAQVSEVWGVGDGRRIEPAAAPAAAGIALFGMRNETLSFQVVARAGALGAQDVRLAVEGLQIGHVRIYRQDEVSIEERSHGLVWRPASAAEPAVPLGPIADRLVPLDGASVTIAPLRTVRFWVDIWVAPNASPGLHTGRISLSSAEGCKDQDQDCTVELDVELLDRTMPDEMTARSMVWFSGSDVDERVMGRYLPDPKQADPAVLERLRLRHYQLAREHRVTLFGQHKGIDRELEVLLSGEAFTEEQGYVGPGAGRGLDLLVLHAYGGELTKEEASEVLLRSRNYSDLKDTIVYTMDEPDSSQWEEINRRVRASKPVPAFVTTLFTPKLETDVFALLAGMYSKSNARKGRDAGKKIWIYNGERPFTGSFAIDDVAVAPRVNPWIQYKLGIARWFYWEATYYHDFQGKRGAIDVAKHALNFTNRHGDRVNGDGLLMYPGRDLLFPDSDEGIDGPLPSVRLKQWRRGIEDVEYLVMARDAGFGAEVDALLGTLLPHILDEREAGDPVGFPEDSASWVAARRYLFELLRDGSSAVQIDFTAQSTPSKTRSKWPWGAAAGLGALAAIAIALWRHRRTS